MAIIEKLADLNRTDKSRNIYILVTIEDVATFSKSGVWLQLGPIPF